MLLDSDRERAEHGAPGREQQNREARGADERRGIHREKPTQREDEESGEEESHHESQVEPSQVLCSGQFVDAPLRVEQGNERGWGALRARVR